MKINAFVGTDLGGAGAAAKRAEALGYDGISSIETAHDPFMPLAMAATHTSKIDLLTSIAVAFARNPMLLANIGHDLNSLSKGRFILGLGSQIEAHITRRFSMPWSKPAARMREMIAAIHAIWDAWYDKKPLDFRGELYTHTLMTPYFTPLDTQHGRPRIMLAAVGPEMTRVAAEVCDGMICHGFTTAKYLREVTIPTIESALAAKGRKREAFEVVCPPMVAMGDNEEELAKGMAGVRSAISFYGSTPAYKGVFETHGRFDLHPQLHKMSKEGKWKEMTTIINEDVIRDFAVVGTPEEVVKGLKAQFNGKVDRTSFDVTNLDPERGKALLKELQAA
jgi:probable F420-dependent oxidoreductase